MNTSQVRREKLLPEYQKKINIQLDIYITRYRSFNRVHDLVNIPNVVVFVPFGNKTFSTNIAFSRQAATVHIRMELQISFGGQNFVTIGTFVSGHFILI